MLPFPKGPRFLLNKVSPEVNINVALRLQALPGAGSSFSLAPWSPRHLPAPGHLAAGSGEVRPWGGIAELRPLSRLETVMQLLIGALIGNAIVPQEHLDLEGVSVFYRASWLAFPSIPRGETRSYT
jgi:hypothetical protein